MKQELILRQSAPQFSSSQLRQWQKYRGWKLRILEELEHSGGMTTREISGRIGYEPRRVTDTLCKMLRDDLVEKVERWGWKISVTGFYLLSLNFTATIQTQHSQNAATLQPQEKEEPAPECFHTKTCHIKRSSQDKRYTQKNATLCHTCVWNKPGSFAVLKPPVEMNLMGSTG